MKKSFLSIAKAYNERDFVRVIEMIDEIILAGGETPDILVLKAASILLVDDNVDFEKCSEEIINCYVSAISLNRNHIDALVDYGIFMYLYMDDVARGERILRRARKLLAKRLGEVDAILNSDNGSE